MFKPFSILLVLCALAAATPFAIGRDAPTIELKIGEAQTPILWNSDGTDRATCVQRIGVPTNSDAIDRAVVTLSEPKFIKRIEARVKDKVVGVYDADGGSDVDPNRATATPIPIAIALPSALADGDELSIWVVPSENATLDDVLEIGVSSVYVDGEAILSNAAPIKYRFGTVVRDVKWDGVDVYRIPGIVKTKNGTLVAVYDARWNGYPDLPANIDVMCSRSFDDGKTWSPMQVVIDKKGEDETKEGVGDPSILVDPETGRVWVAALWAHNGKSTAASEPGLEFGRSGRFIICYSDDDGATWSEPRDVTNEAAPDVDWRIFFQGPGCGITTRDGKLVFPAQFIDKAGVWYSTLLTSADKGETWRGGTGAHKMTCESQVVELNDGSLMLNMRNFNGKPRSVATTTDYGKTWTEHPTSEKALVEPVCQASLIRVKAKADGDDGDLLAFMNPNHPKGRVDMTIKLSEDEGQTWPRELTLYRPGGLGYSCLVKLDDDTLGAFYETMGGLVFQRVKIADIPSKAK